MEVKFRYQKKNYFEVSAAFYIYIVENKLEHISRYKLSIE